MAAMEAFCATTSEEKHVDVSFISYWAVRSRTFINQTRWCNARSNSKPIIVRRLCRAPKAVKRAGVLLCPGRSLSSSKKKNKGEIAAPVSD